MEIIQESEPKIDKPIIIAAMQDMGNVGSIVISFLNKKLETKRFRMASSSYPSYVLDKGGYIEIPDEKWEYRFAEDIIIFGGGIGQPHEPQELQTICQDVIDIAKKYSAKFIYTVGGFHTDRKFGKEPKTYVTATSSSLARQLQDLEISTTPQKSVITGFNGLILGFSKLNDIQGMGLYGELNNPEIPQYRSAISIIKTLEKLTFRKFGDLRELEILAEDIESKIDQFSDFGQ